MTQPVRQIAFDLPLRPAHGREDFMIGPANVAAVAWIDRWPEWPSPVLILNGPAASGKTHLTAVWQERAKAKLVSAGDLASREAESIAGDSQHIAIDGLDLWLGDPAAENTLFHLYNMFREQKRFMLLGMRMSLFQADFALADLESRLRAAPVASIQPPDDDLLASVLIKQFHDRQLSVGEEVIRYALPRMERSFAAARDIASMADRIALAQKSPVSIAVMRQVLAGL